MYYMAPEAFNKDYNDKGDVWSVGVILYILICGHPPYRGKNFEETKNLIQNAALEFKKSTWQSISKDAKDLLLKMLAKNPENRPSAAEALQHQWFENKMRRLTMQSGEGVFDSKRTEVLKNIREFNGTLKMQQAAMAYI